MSDKILQCPLAKVSEYEEFLYQRLNDTLRRIIRCEIAKGIEDTCEAALEIKNNHTGKLSEEKDHHHIYWISRGVYSRFFDEIESMEGRYPTQEEIAADQDMETYQDEEQTLLGNQT